MALQSSGAIAISQIKAELGSPSNSLRTLSSLAGKSTPDAMSEFYGYSAAPPYNEGLNITYQSSNMNLSFLQDFDNPPYGSWQNNYTAGNSTNYNQPYSSAQIDFQLYSSTYTYIYLDFGWDLQSEACCDIGYIELSGPDGDRKLTKIKLGSDQQEGGVGKA